MKSRTFLFGESIFGKSRSFNWTDNFSSTMDTIDEYGRDWVKRKDSDVNTFLDWIELNWGLTSFSAFSMAIEGHERREQEQIQTPCSVTILRSTK